MEQRRAVEQQIQALTEDSEYAQAAELALGFYGDELLGFLMGSLQSKEVAEDVFQNFSLEMWRGLPRFEWRSSLRTWLYMVARGVISKHLRDPYRRRSEVLSVAAQDQIPMRLARTATQTWRKTETKSRLWDLCVDLPQADRQLLQLRIGRGMSWSDIALILDEADEADARRRAAARLRKRFERLKSQLHVQMNSSP